MATSKSSRDTSRTDVSKGDGGAGEVQAKFDEINVKGFFGERTDPTPLENYTVAGVVAEKPTPETDADAAAKAAEVTNTAPKVVS